MSTAAKLGVAALIAGALYLCMPLLLRAIPGCHSQVLSRIESTNHQATASLMQTRCSRQDLFSGTEVRLTVQGDRSEMVIFQGPSTITDVLLTWEADQHLVVSYPEAAHPQTWRGSAGGVSVEYRSVGATGKN